MMTEEMETRSNCMLVRRCRIAAASASDTVQRPGFLCGA
jgi:hypothetical protein